MDKKRTPREAVLAAEKCVHTLKTTRKGKVDWSIWAGRAGLMPIGSGSTLSKAWVNAAANLKRQQLQGNKA